MLSRTSVGIAAAGAGLCFLGYCIYFDRKRRSDPDFKKKLRERRNKARTAASASGPSSVIELPDMSNPQSVQRFFFKEMQLGEELLNAGDLEAGIEHLGNALVISGQTSQLLGVLQQTLTPQIFSALVQSLPAAAKRLQNSLGSAETPSGPTITTLKEDDVE